MTIDPIHLETEGDPIFHKRRIHLYGLREPVHKVKLQNEGIIHAVYSSLWATPIVPPLKKEDGVTPRICGDYRMTVNKVLKNISAQQKKQKTNSTALSHPKHSQ